MWFVKFHWFYNILIRKLFDSADSETTHKYSLPNCTACELSVSCIHCYVIMKNGWIFYNEPLVIHSNYSLNLMNFLIPLSAFYIQHP